MAFRFPPYDMADLAKMRTPMKVSFKKGETMEDQTFGSGLGNLKSTAVVASIVIALSGVVRKYSK